MTAGLSPHFERYSNSGEEGGGGYTAEMENGVKNMVYAKADRGGQGGGRNIQNNEYKCVINKHKIKVCVN